MPLTIAAAVALLAVPVHLQAGIVTLNATWSGVPNGNSASATGTFQIDSAVLSDLLTNAESSSLDFDPTTIFTSGSITITGTTGGDGTFTLSDFTGSNGFAIWTAGANFNLTENWVGQADTNGTWGTPDGSNGDFNFFGNGGNAPNGDFFFELGANNDTAEVLQLTSIEEVSGVPEPAPATLGAGGLLLVGLGLLRKRAQASATA